jgi:hypothetical protein
LTKSAEPVPGSLDKKGEDGAVFYQTKMENRWNLSSTFLSKEPGAA